MHITFGKAHSQLLLKFLFKISSMLTAPPYLPWCVILQFQLFQCSTVFIVIRLTGKYEVIALVLWFGSCCCCFCQTLILEYRIIIWWVTFRRCHSNGILELFPYENSHSRNIKIRDCKRWRTCAVVLVAATVLGLWSAWLQAEANSLLGLLFRAEHRWMDNMMITMGQLVQAALPLFIPPLFIVLFCNTYPTFIHWVEAGSHRFLHTGKKSTWQAILFVWRMVICPLGKWNLTALNIPQDE